MPPERPGRRGVASCPCNDGDPCNYEDHGETTAMPTPARRSGLARLRVKLADALMPWAAANASVWPSQHATHQTLMEARRAERAQAAYLVGRLHDALREVDPGYVGSPLEVDEVRAFLDGHHA